MYKWPTKDLPPAEFEGLRVEMVAFTENTIAFHFQGNYSVTLESCAIFNVNGVDEEVAIPPKSTNLTLLLGGTVRRSLLDVDAASLLLEFDGGIRLRLEGGSEQYECFHVNANGREFTI